MCVPCIKYGRGVYVGVGGVGWCHMCAVLCVCEVGVGAGGACSCEVGEGVGCACVRGEGVVCECVR